MNAILTLATIKAFTKFSAAKCTSNKCLIGKTAVITGSTTGIGYETSKQLASRGCRIYMCGAINLNEEIMELLRYAFNNKELYYHPITLSSFESVRKFCDYIKSREQKVDILIHNAEAMGNPRFVTEDKVLQVMQVNHLSPFLMTHLLKDQLSAAEGGRVIYVSNIIGYFGTLWRPKDVSNVGKMESSFINLLDYSNSKCCQMIVAKMFADKLRQNKITCNVVYPGWVDIESRKVHNSLEDTTWLMGISKVFFDMWIWIYGKTLIEGTQMNLHAAMSKTLDKTTGRFIMDKFILPMPYYTYRREYCEAVWHFSEELCKLRPEEKLVTK